MQLNVPGSHGLSVGSLAKTNADTVKNVYVSGATMIDSTKAAGIKLYEGGSSHGTATVTNVTWDGVTVNGCDYAFQVQSCYGSESDADCEDNPSAAVLDQIYIKNFSGTTSSTYAPVTANINCPSAGTCNLKFTDWSVGTASGTAKILCNNIDGSPGITCVSGASG
jgi:galacturan 1,4-alpha-galacturonidase